MTAAVLEAPSTDGKIVCQIDNAMCHSIVQHLKTHHPDWTIERYKTDFPNAPLLSAKAKEIVERRRKEKSREAAISSIKSMGSVTTEQKSMAEIFDLGNVKAAKSSSGNPIMLDVFKGYTDPAFKAEIDMDYVFNIDLLKKVCVGFQVNMPVYLWGFHGTGKTTILKQAAARTGRPFLRVQHTQNTEEAHILGQYVVVTKDVEVEEIHDGKREMVMKSATITEFQPGPLITAMKEGYVYCADEYDQAMPGVVSVYQPVLEGENLVVKDAPPEYRVIKPHPNFRFCATGNTNGIGDETGLYQGTIIQNAANYSRFAITEEVAYMSAKIEQNIIVSRTGVDAENAARIIKVASEVRTGFKEGTFSMTVSPRELINVTNLGVLFGGDFKLGFQLAFGNRLSRVDQEAFKQFAQRVFG